jgi:hypothetical protein
MESKESLTRSDVAPDITGLCRQIERWRRTRRHREPMPESLWTLAASLARQHSVARIARFARLDYYTLKRRLDVFGRDRAAKPEKAPAFIELPLPLCASVPECIVELERPERGRMRIHIKGAAVPDLAELSRSFWSMGS